MARTASSKLYKLIHKMSGSEKRYFKIFAATHALPDSKSVQLFDILAHQKEQDDDQAGLILYGHTKSDTKKFTELKAFLYDLVLRALEDFDSETSIDFKLKSYLTQIRVLYKRGLYEGCKELMAKAKRLGLLYEEFTTLIEILRWEKQIAYAESNIDYLVKELQRIENEENMYMSKLKNVAIFRNTFFKVLANVRKQEAQSHNTVLVELDRIVSEPEIALLEQAQSHLAMVIYYRIHSLYSFARLDYPNFYTYSKNLLSIMDDNPHFTDEDATEYISALSNFMKSCFAHEQYDDAYAYIQKFKDIKTKTTDDEVKVHRQYYQSMFQLCSTTGQFEQGAKEVEIHLRKSQKFDSQLFANASFYFAYFYIYFGARQYMKALGYLNMWLSVQKGMDRQDLTMLSRLLNIIIHYELDNTQLIESLMRSTYRSLRKLKRKAKIELQMLNFIKATQQVKNKKELLDLFVQIKAEFEILAKIPKESTLFLYFDFIAWLDSKIQNKTFAQIVQHRFEQRRIKA